MRTRGRIKLTVVAGVALMAGTGIGLTTVSVAAPASASPPSSTLTVGPTDVAAGSTGNLLTFTFTAAATDVGGMLTVVLPASVGTPQATNPSGADYISAASGTCASAILGGVSSQTVKIKTLTCDPGQTAIISWRKVTAPTQSGSYPVTATEKRESGVTRQPLLFPQPIVVDPGPAAKLRAVFSSTLKAGCASTILISAKDQFGNLATGYSGTVKVTSDDPRAILPAPYTFTRADAGAHQLPIDFRLANQVTYKVADTAGSPPNPASGSVTVFSPTSIALSPINGSIQVGAGVQYQTIATFPDNSTCDITATALYASSKTSVASISSSGLAHGVGAGTTLITANDGATTVGTNLQVVKDTTSTSLAADVNPSTFGQTVNLSSTVTGGGSTPTGTVSFFDGSTLLGTVSLTSGSATLPVSTLSVGSHSLTAVYSGDATNAASTSSVLSEIVNPAPTTTSAAATGDGVAGDPVQLSAVVAPASGNSPTGPTGTVTFSVNGTDVGVGTVDNTGTATFSDSGADFASGAMAYSVTATYSGDGNFTTSSGSTSYTTN